MLIKIHELLEKNNKNFNLIKMEHENIIVALKYQHWIRHMTKHHHTFNTAYSWYRNMIRSKSKIIIKITSSHLLYQKHFRRIKSPIIRATDLMLQHALREQPKRLKSEGNWCWSMFAHTTSVGRYTPLVLVHTPSPCFPSPNSTPSPPPPPHSTSHYSNHFDTKLRVGRVYTSMFNSELFRCAAHLTREKKYR